jgi:hypothetical protein
VARRLKQENCDGDGESSDDEGHGERR